MPVEKNQISFAGGEIAPALYAHTDLVKYITGLRTCRNWFIHVQGGASNRAGTEYIIRNKDNSKRARLVPFKFGVEQNYVLELTENLMRVFRNKGLVLEPTKSISGITKANPGVVTATSHGYSNGQWVWITGVGGMVEVNDMFFKVANVTTNTFELNDLSGNPVNTTGYTTYTSGGTAARVFEMTHTYAEDDLRLLKYTQSADVMTICHTGYVQSELSRTQHYEWSLDEIEFEPEIAWPAGLTGTNSSSGSETYKYKVTAIAEETAEESLVGTEPTKNITAITKANPAVVTITSHGYSNGDEVYITGVGGMTELNGRRFEIAGVTANTFQLVGENSTGYGTYTSGGTAARTHLQIGSAAVLSSSVFNTITIPAVSGAQSYNVYKYDNGIYGFIGTTEINTFVDDNITADLNDTPPRGRDPFANGNYPGAATYHKQRRVFGGPNANPQTIYGTQTGNYKNMNVSTPTKDDDAITFTLNSEEVQQIRHLTSLKKLIVFTSGSSWIVRGASDTEIITPTSIDADEEFVNACSHIRPLRIGRDIIYVEEGGKDVLFLAFSLEADGLDGEPLTLVSGHLFKRREVLEWCYTRKPFSIVWCVTDTGELLGLTYNRKEQVWAWHRHDTDGYVESVASIREEGEDYLYLSVRRTIDGVTQRYTERMHSRNFFLVEDAFFVDSGLTVDNRNTNSSATMIVTGGTTWKTTETLTLTENGTLSPFVPSDVGRIMELRIKDSDGKITDRCQFEITAFTSSTVVSVVPLKIVPAALRAVATSEWAFTFNTITGAEHLEGKTVSILADGNVEPPQVVTDGSFMLQQNYSVVHFGLPYDADLETLDVDFTRQGLETKTKKKGISEVTFICEETRGLFAGPDADNLVEYQQRDDEDYDEPTNLLTGQAEIAIQPTWTDGGRVFVRVSDPLPATILAAIPEVELSD